MDEAGFAFDEVPDLLVATVLLLEPVLLLVLAVLLLEPVLLLLLLVVLAVFLLELELLCDLLHLDESSLVAPAERPERRSPSAAQEAT